MPLTDKQTIFVQEYLGDAKFVATQAAIIAGYSEKTARQIGSRLLSNVNIQEAIATAMAERAKRNELTQDIVTQALLKIAQADIRDVVTWADKPKAEKNEDGSERLVYPVELRPSETMDDDVAFAVAEVSLTSGGVKVKMHDKKGAWVELGRSIGMFGQHVTLTGPRRGPIETITTDISAKEAAEKYAGTLNGDPS